MLSVHGLRTGFPSFCGSHTEIVALLPCNDYCCYYYVAAYYFVSLRCDRQTLFRLSYFFFSDSDDFGGKKQGKRRLQHKTGDR